MERATPAPPLNERLDTRRVFLAGIGLVYLVAFVSLWFQVQGLFGSDGIVPLEEGLNEIARERPPWLEAPTLLWLDAGDATLHALCGLGVLGAVLVVLGLAPRLVLVGLWACYLSFVVAGYPFLYFQWDMLLLEAGLLAALYAPGGWRPFRGPQVAPSRVIRWLLVWLLFRLMFNSGLVKLQAGDDCWWDLSALEYHYWTQPLPHVGAWLADRLPALVGKVSTALMFAVEVVAPFLFFGPRRARIAGFLATTLLMLLIAATGNYGFFNMLTVVLCVPLLDDRSLRRALPFLQWGERAPCRPARWPLLRGLGAALFVPFVLLVTTWRAGWLPPLPDDLRRPLERASHFHSFNAYGLFRVMTRTRPEITVLGSADRREWKPYAFRWKPGDLDRAPGFAGLHMPRLDWQMWFAALSGRPPSWYRSFLERLLEGSPSVTGLLGTNPFPEEPPVYVRSRLDLYRFTEPEARDEPGRDPQRVGRWWSCERVGPYGPMLRRDPDGRIHVLRR